MEKISRIGMDTSKSVFQLHGVDETGEVVLRKKLTRKAMVSFFEKLPPTVVGVAWKLMVSGQCYDPNYSVAVTMATV